MSPLIWSPGCTAFSHTNGFHFLRVGNTSSTFPSRRSTPFPTNGRPSENQPFFSDSPEGSHSAWFQAEKPMQEVYTSHASLRVIFSTTPSITQNRRDSHALQHTEGIVPLEAWSNSRIHAIAARLPYSDDELKESKCPVRSKKITLYGSSIMLSKSNLCCHRITFAIDCRMHGDYVPSYASVVSRPPRR
ncbi:hypothetical protein AVEN_215903-1 [Araneus ventricosus]|uniref:Uncharacterized protein n=1 Tax=Araneus ventricosus TaxID=182803 RepID=A0A4Y2VW76_ARAVE|nr:hypothetical protein AVEN_215903-1 [Araneus ventricosus]